ncbi:hypothetical protein BHE74_00049644 [Ensete ventricosum]|nr:hypothetical protein GW17_00043036 [Ensete ventricosum]RWW44583.1 hypothetical protein BHE74_00049644 [Ensete ventricosum]RZS28181.1 hypothetical protein BHM03_00061745 [Ensete ventricosum]
MRVTCGDTPDPISSAFFPRAEEKNKRIIISRRRIYVRDASRTNGQDSLALDSGLWRAHHRSGRTLILRAVVGIARKGGDGGG